MKSGNDATPSRRGGWVLFLFLSVPAPGVAAEPEIRFTSLHSGKPLVVEVFGLSGADLEQLRRAKKVDWPSLFSVRVVGSSTELLGVYSVGKESLRFESRYPPAAGIKFRATFDPKKTPVPIDGQLVTAQAGLPKQSTSATTTIEQVFPTSDTLPENHLRFYIHFSAPMSRHEAYARLKLLDEKGKQVSEPYLELGEELWDTESKRFTLYLHPGRVKRGLKPREELGPILENGKRYTLVVAATWPDADGRPLKSEFRKSFRVGPPDETQPDPKAWKLIAPPEGGRDPLELRFPKPLDYALLKRMLWVEDNKGQRVAGVIDVSTKETQWTFRPAQPWMPGDYKLMIDSALEDPAGNSIARPFELDLIEPRPDAKPRIVELKFAPK